MISYSVYKVMHLMGVLMVFLALGGLVTGTITKTYKGNSWRKSIAITHGVGLLVSLIGGFGLLARLGVVHGMLPGWAIAKLCIWLFFGATMGLIPRKPELAKPLWILVIILGALAAYLAGSKPDFGL